jgi:type VI secretion system protein ImpK
MREAEDLGDPASLRKLIRYYLELFEKNCKALKIPDDSITETKYAIVALIDETVLSTESACKEYWFSRPLQLDLFGDNIAGEEFYYKLQKLLLSIESKKDVLEIYYICLSLGFEGKYKLYNAEERITIIEDVGRKIRRTRIRSSLGLSPHGNRSDSPRSGGRAFFFPIWLSGSLVAIALTGYYLFLHFKNTSQVSAVIAILDKMTFK